MPASKVDLNGLSKNEQQSILQVIRRDLTLRKTEDNRIAQLSQRLPVKTDINDPEKCVVCGSSFFWLFNPKMQCSSCAKYFCKSKPTCGGTDVTNLSVFRCSLCMKEWEVRSMTVEWFYSQFRKRFRRHGGAKILRELDKRRREVTGIGSPAAIQEVVFKSTDCNANYGNSTRSLSEADEIEVDGTDTEIDTSLSVELEKVINKILIPKIEELKGSQQPKPKPEISAQVIENLFENFLQQAATQEQTKVTATKDFSNTSPSFKDAETMTELSDSDIDSLFSRKSSMRSRSSFKAPLSERMRNLSPESLRNVLNMQQGLSKSSFVGMQHRAETKEEMVAKADLNAAMAEIFEERGQTFNALRPQEFSTELKFKALNTDPSALESAIQTSAFTSEEDTNDMNDNDSTIEPVSASSTHSSFSFLPSSSKSSFHGDNENDDDAKTITTAVASNLLTFSATIEKANKNSRTHEMNTKGEIRANSELELQSNTILQSNQQSNYPASCNKESSADESESESRSISLKNTSDQLVNISSLASSSTITSSLQDDDNEVSGINKISFMKQSTPVMLSSNLEGSVQNNQVLLHETSYFDVKENKKGSNDNCLSKTVVASSAMRKHQHFTKSRHSSSSSSSREIQEDFIPKPLFIINENKSSKIENQNYQIDLQSHTHSNMEQIPRKSIREVMQDLQSAGMEIQETKFNRSSLDLSDKRKAVLGHDQPKQSVAVSKSTNDDKRSKQVFQTNRPTFKVDDQYKESHISSSNKCISISATQAHHQFSSKEEEISKPHFSQPEIFFQYSSNETFSVPLKSLSEGHAAADVPFSIDDSKITNEKHEGSLKSDSFEESGHVDDQKDIIENSLQLQEMPKKQNFFEKLSSSSSSSFSASDNDSDVTDLDLETSKRSFCNETVSFSSCSDKSNSKILCNKCYIQPKRKETCDKDTSCTSMSDTTRAGKRSFDKVKQDGDFNDLEFIRGFIEMEKSGSRNSSFRTSRSSSDVNHELKKYLSNKGKQEFPLPPTINHQVAPQASSQVVVTPVPAPRSYRVDSSSSSEQSVTQNRVAEPNSEINRHNKISPPEAKPTARIKAKPRSKPKKKQRSQMPPAKDQSQRKQRNPFVIEI